MAEPAKSATGRLLRVILDEDQLTGLTPTQEADRNQAITDLAADNRFALATDPDRNTILHLSEQDGRLIFDIRSDSNETLHILALAPGPFRSMIRDYQMLLDSYAAAVAEGREARIQAIDMGRRGLHNEGAELVMTRLENKILLNFDTARRIFTLVCALHRRM